MSALTNDMAQKMILLANNIAKEQYGRPICFSICDEYGFLLAFSRMDGAPIRSIAISQSKAYTAVRVGVHTHEFYARLLRDNLQISYFADSQLTALPGGFVLRNSAGEMIGGIGVSALATSEDQKIVEIIAEAVRDGKL